MLQPFQDPVATMPGNELTFQNLDELKPRAEKILPNQVGDLEVFANAH